MKSIEVAAAPQTERFSVGQTVIVRYTPPLAFNEPGRDCPYRVESISPTGLVAHLSRLDDSAGLPFGPRRRVKRNRWGGFTTGPHDVVLTLEEAAEDRDDAK
jgi:hypothetical protein